MGDWLDDCELGDTAPPKETPTASERWSPDERAAIARYDAAWQAARIKQPFSQKVKRAKAI